MRSIESKIEQSPNDVNLLIILPNIVVVVGPNGYVGTGFVIEVV